MNSRRRNVKPYKMLESDHFGDLGVDRGTMLNYLAEVRCVVVD
jgi:hypothetical protein